MGKKGKKKITWKRLSISEEEDESVTNEETPTKTQGGGASVMNGGSKHKPRPPPQNPAPNHHYHPQHNYHYARTHRSRYQHQPLVTTQKLTFNEEEYTKITTPRQDVLFKKGYLCRKKTVPTDSAAVDGNQTSATNVDVTNGNAQVGEETTHPVVNGVCNVENDEAVDYLQGMQMYEDQYVEGYVDAAGSVYAGSYEFYDPYTGTYLVAAGPNGAPPPYLPPGGQMMGPIAVPMCPIPGPMPLQPIEWYNPRLSTEMQYFYAISSCPSQDQEEDDEDDEDEYENERDEKRTKRYSTDSQNYSSTQGTGSSDSSPPPSGEPGTPLEDEDESIAMSSPTDSSAPMTPPIIPIPTNQHPPSMVPVMMTSSPYVYPGYLFGPAVYNVNGLVHHQLVALHHGGGAVVPPTQHLTVLPQAVPETTQNDEVVETTPELTVVSEVPVEAVTTPTPVTPTDESGTKELRSKNSRRKRKKRMKKREEKKEDKPPTTTPDFGSEESFGQRRRGSDEGSVDSYGSKSSEAVTVTPVDPTPEVTHKNESDSDPIVEISMENDAIDSVVGSPVTESHLAGEMPIEKVSETVFESTNSETCMKSAGKKTASAIAEIPNENASETPIESVASETSVESSATYTPNVETQEIETETASLSSKPSEEFQKENVRETSVDCATSTQEIPTTVAPPSSPTDDSSFEIELLPDQLQFATERFVFDDEVMYHESGMVLPPSPEIVCPYRQHVPGEPPRLDLRKTVILEENESSESSESITCITTKSREQSPSNDDTIAQLDEDDLLNDLAANLTISVIQDEINDVCRQVIDDSVPCFVLTTNDRPITQAVTRWLENNAEVFVVPNLNDDSTDDDDNDSGTDVSAGNTCPKNGVGNPLTAPSNSCEMSRDCCLSNNDGPGKRVGNKSVFYTDYDEVSSQVKFSPSRLMTKAEKSFGILPDVDSATDETDEDVLFISSLALLDTELVDLNSMQSDPISGGDGISRASSSCERYLEKSHLLLDPAKYAKYYQLGVTLDIDDIEPTPVAVNNCQTKMEVQEEIRVHMVEDDRVSECGSEDIEMINHRYESPFDRDGPKSEIKHQDQLETNRISLAAELVRLREPLPESWDLSPIQSPDITKVHHGNSEIYRQRYGSGPENNADSGVQSEESEEESSAAAEKKQKVPRCPQQLHPTIIRQLKGETPVPCGICCSIQ